MNIVYKWMASKKPRKHVVKYRKNGDFYIICGKQLEICYLNTTAGLILSLCDGKNTIQDIENYMLKRFDVEATVIENDIVNTIRNLQWKQLVILEE